MSGWRPRLFPRRISGQIALLLVVSLTLTHAVFSIALFRSETSRDEASSPRALIGAFITVARMVAADADPARRQAMIAATRATYPATEITYIAADDPATATPAVNGERLGRRLAFISRELGIHGARLVPGEGERAIRLILADGGEVRAMLPEDRWRGFFFGPIEMTLLFVVISLVLIFVWAARWVTAPLSAFARAASEFSLESDRQPLPEVGPEEIQAAAKAFNRMRERIAGLVGDRTRMLAAVGHDLRTPITRLRLRAEFIEDEATRREVLRDLDRMGAMVEAALAHLKSEQTAEKMAPLDLPTVLQTICDGFVDMGEAVDYEGPDHLLVDGRVEDLVRGFENIVKNAVKYGTRATVRLVPPADGRVTITIDDDGPGIAEAERARMAEPFVRGDAARAIGDKTGFGLGLSIASGIFAAHGGAMRLEDAPGGGLRVAVELPAHG